MPEAFGRVIFTFINHVYCKLSLKTPETGISTLGYNMMFVVGVSNLKNARSLNM